MAKTACVASHVAKLGPSRNGSLENMLDIWKMVDPPPSPSQPMWSNKSEYFIFYFHLNDDGYEQKDSELYHKFLWSLRSGSTWTQLSQAVVSSVLSSASTNPCKGHAPSRRRALSRSRATWLKVLYALSPVAKAYYVDWNKKRGSGALFRGTGLDNHTNAYCANWGSATRPPPPPPLDLEPETMMHTPLSPVKTILAAKLRGA